MKSATNMRRRPVVDLLRRAELLDDAVVHHDDLVAHLHRLELVVGDVDRGRAHAVVQRAQLLGHVLAELGVERAERLVHQEALGSRTMARPSATRWRSPPERPPTGRSRMRSMPRMRRHLLDLGARPRRGGMPWLTSG